MGFKDIGIWKSEFVKNSFIQSYIRNSKPFWFSVNSSSTNDWEHNSLCWRAIYFSLAWPRAAIVLLNFRAGSMFPAPVCTVSPGHQVNKQILNRTSRLTRSDFRLNLLVLKGQRCEWLSIKWINVCSLTNKPKV